MVTRYSAHREVTRALLIACIGLSGCGPELTTPGKADISGTWFAPGPAVGLTSIYITVAQSSDGAISGVYTADGTPGVQTCPPTPKCTIGGAVNGTNTVLQVFLELQNVGTFTGQVIDVRTLKGGILLGSVVQPVEFAQR